MKKFTKIYIEITNRCNLNCSFCGNNKRAKQDMTLEQFEHIIKQLPNVTKSIYLHVKGESLLHPHFEEILKLCEKYRITVNITTNGTLINKQLSVLKKYNVKQLNISLHSEKEKDVVEIFKAVDQLKKTTVIYRFWTQVNKEFDLSSRESLQGIIKYYNLDDKTISLIKSEMNIKINDHTYIDKEEMFHWPDIEYGSKTMKGFCHGLRTHIAILVDGSVLPCCMDGEGKLILGNVFQETIEEILNKEKSQKIVEGFRNRLAVEELCQHCEIKERF